MASWGDIGGKGTPLLGGRPGLELLSENKSVLIRLQMRVSLSKVEKSISSKKQTFSYRRYLYDVFGARVYPRNITGQSKQNIWIYSKNLNRQTPEAATKQQRGFFGAKTSMDK